MYGQIEFRSSKITPAGKFGETISIGWTLGEEILYQEDSKQIYRTENCISINESCMLTVAVDDLASMNIKKAVMAGGGTLTKDY
jgi:hypothetical protein